MVSMELLKDYVIPVLHEYGLKSATFSAHITPINNNIIMRILWEHEIKAIDTVKENYVKAVIDYAKKVASEIEASPFYNNIKQKHANDIQEQLDRIVKLHNEIEELKKYKHYYELEYLNKHGKKITEEL